MSPVTFSPNFQMFFHFIFVHLYICLLLYTTQAAEIQMITYPLGPFCSCQFLHLSRRWLSEHAPLRLWSELLLSRASTVALAILAKKKKMCEIIEKSRDLQYRCGWKMPFGPPPSFLWTGRCHMCHRFMADAKLGKKSECGAFLSIGARLPTAQNRQSN